MVPQAQQVPKIQKKRAPPSLNDGNDFSGNTLKLT